MAAPEQGKARFDTRLSVEQKLLFERAAVLGGFRNLTDFVMRTVQERAEALIEEKEQFIASQRDSELFFKAITGHKMPNKRLVKAAKAYREQVAE